MQTLDMKKKPNAKSCFKEVALSILKDKVIKNGQMDVTAILTNCVI